MNGFRGQAIIANRAKNRSFGFNPFKRGHKGQPQTHGLKSSERFGTVFFEDFPGAAFTADWSVFGTTPPTVSGGNAVFTSGSGLSTWNRGVRNITHFSNLNNFRLEVFGVQITFVPGATTTGIGIGLDSAVDNALSKSSFGAYVNMTNGADGGRLVIGKLNSARSFTATTQTPANTITKAQNDIFDFVIERNDTIIKFSAKKTTDTEWASVQDIFQLDTSSPQFLPNRWLICLFGLGTAGTTNVGSVRYISLEPKSCHYCLLGDSIGTGYSANARLYRLMERTFAGLDRTFMNLASQGNKAQDFYAGNSNEITSYRVQKAYIVQVGTNNVEHDTLASYQTGITAIVDAIVAAGGDAILCTLLPRNDGLDVRPFNDWLYTTFAPKKATVGTYGRRFKICDFYTSFRDRNHTAFNGNPKYYDDTVHPNPEGFSKMGLTLRSCIMQYESGII